MTSATVISGTDGKNVRTYSSEKGLCEIHDGLLTSAEESEQSGAEEAGFIPPLVAEAQRQPAA